MFNIFKKRKKSETVSESPANQEAYEGQRYYSQPEYSIYDGEKFFGGFGITQLQIKDYWTLRQRSVQLFNDNLYARGLIRRLITNEISTGLTPEAIPDEEIIGVEEDSLTAWSETVENRFGIWAKNPNLCDWEKRRTFGQIQRDARRQALIDGDVLWILRQSPTTKLPMVQILSGGLVRTPLGGDGAARNGHKICHGVETDKQGRQVAYWVAQADNTTKRVPAWGEKSGRRIAWLQYGTDKLVDDVRGDPLLSIVLQSLKEIDRYRDSTQRKATINSILAMFIKKGEDKPSTLPIQGGATRRDVASIEDGDGKTRELNVTKHIPGLVMEELQTGEEPVSFSGQIGGDDYSTFEAAVINAIAWACEVPPEIMTLAFSNNYSASQAAINEFKMYLNLRWMDFGETACTPIYIEWLLSEVLLGKVSAPGLLEAWRNPSMYDVFGAWVSVEWYGSIKPSTDMLKQAKGSKMLVDEGWSTNAREARITTGTKFSKNMKRLRTENELKVAAMRPLAEFRAEFGEEEANEAMTALKDDLTDAVISAVEEVA